MMPKKPYFTGTSSHRNLSWGEFFSYKTIQFFLQKRTICQQIKIMPI